MPEAANLRSGHSPSRGATLGVSQPGADRGSSPAPWLRSSAGRLIFNLADTLFTPGNLL